MSTRELTPPSWHDDIPLASPEDLLPSDDRLNSGVASLEARPQPTGVEGVSLYDMLIKGRQGPKPGSFQNASLFLNHHRALRGRLAFDLFCNANLVVQSLPWERPDDTHPRRLDDSDAISFVTWLERHGQFGFKKSMAMDALLNAARENRFDSLTGYLETIRWDGVPRIDQLFERYFGAEQSPYLAMISPKFLIGSVARALKPGVKLDTMVVLEGSQGAGKSTGIRVLFGDAFFSDEIADFGSKDAAQQMQGKWCIEVAELSALGRSDVRAIKAFLSRQKDRFRAPYERLVGEHPRRCILIGSSNDDTYLRDATGGRRFWPVSCKRIDLLALKQDRDQLWAEATCRFRQGESWWLSTAEQALASKEQDQRYDEDGWLEVIISSLDLAGVDEISTFDVCRNHLCLEVGRIGRSEQMRAADALKRMKWTSHQVWIAGRNMRVWRRPTC